MRQNLSYLVPFLLVGFACSSGVKPGDTGDGDGDGNSGGQSGSGGNTLGTGGTDPGAGGTPGTGGGGPGSGGGGNTQAVCPAGSDSLTLNLAGVTLAPVAGIMNNYEGFGNIEGPVWIGDAL